MHNDWNWYTTATEQEEPDRREQQREATERILGWLVIGGLVGGFWTLMFWAVSAGMHAMKH